jgi:hypothetical protein
LIIRNAHGGDAATVSNLLLAAAGFQEEQGGACAALRARARFRGRGARSDPARPLRARARGLRPRLAQRAVRVRGSGRPGAAAATSAGGSQEFCPRSGRPAGRAQEGADRGRGAQWRADAAGQLDAALQGRAEYRHPMGGAAALRSLRLAAEGLGHARIGQCSGRREGSWR